MILTALLVICLAAPAAGETVAQVDAVKIGSSSVLRRVEAARARRQVVSPGDALNELIAEALLAKDADRLGVRAAPDVTSRVEEATRQAALETMVEKDLAAKVTTPDAELRELFHSTADFARYHFLAFATADAARAAADRLRGGATLEEVGSSALVARIHKDPAQAETVLRAQMEPDLAKAVFSGSDGAVLGPIPLKTGFATVKLIDKYVGSESSFLAQRPSLTDHARKARVKTMKQHLATQLAAKANVAVDEAFLGRLQGAEATAAELDHVLATVNGRPLRYREIYAAVRYLGSGHLSGSSVKVQLAQNQVSTMLLEDLAMQRGFGKDQDTLARVAEEERSILAAAGAAKIGERAGPPSESEIEAYYRANSARYGKPFSKVLPAAAADAAAQKRADAVRARVAELRGAASVRIFDDALSRAAAQTR